MFGCPGKKAYDRRRDLGEAAGHWCDRVYLTEEDSGEEDTLDICREIAPNVEKAGCPVRIIPNRGEAIRQAVLDCAGPSVLLLTGKGRETRQKRGTAYIDTPTDVEYVQAFLQEYDLRRGLDRESPARAMLSILPALEARREELWVVCCPSSQEEAAARDAAALSRAGVRVILVRRGSGPLPAALSGNGVTLSAGDGGLLHRADTGFTVRPKVLDTLLDGGFLPVLEGGEEEALAVAQATRAHRLVLFTTQEPSLALGVDRQVELSTWTWPGPPSCARRGSSPQRQTGPWRWPAGPWRGASAGRPSWLRVQTTSCCWTLWDSTSRGSPSPRDLPQTKRTQAQRWKPLCLC